MLLVALVFHHQTSSSNTAKDIYALWFAPALLALSAVLFVRDGHLRPGPSLCFAALSAYLILGAVHCTQSDYRAFAWVNWRLLMAWTLPLFPAYLLAVRPRSGERLAFAATAMTALITLYALLQCTAYTFENLWGWGKGIDPVSWPWHIVPLVSSAMEILETDLRRFAWQSFPGIGPVAAVCSTFGNPTYLAGYYALVVPFFAGLLLARREKRKPVWVLSGLLVAMLFALATTTSKGGLLGLLGGLGTLLVLVSFTGVSWLSPAWVRISRWLGAGVLAAGAAALALVFVLVSPSVEGFKEELSSVRNRAIVYAATVDLIQDHPLFGVGPGSFAIEFPTYLEGKMAEEFGWNESPEEKVLDHAHNEFLEVLAELGTVGFLLFATALISGFAWMFKALRQEGPAGPRMVLAGIFAGLIGMLWESLASVSLRWIPASWMYWAMFGAGLGLATRLHGAPTPPFRPTLGKSAWPLAAAAGIVLLLSPPTVRLLTADWHFVNGKVAVAQKQASAEKELIRATELDPNHAQAHYLLAGQYFTAEDFESSIDRFLRVREIRGDVVVLAENLATAYFKLSVVSESEADRQAALLEAVRIYEECLDRHPGFPRLEDYLSRAYFRLGLEYQASLHRKRAIELYEQWFVWPGSFPRPNYALDLAKNYLMEDENEKAFWQLRNAWRWDGDPPRVQSVLDSLFQIDPSYREKWDTVIAKDAAAAREPK